MKTLVVVACMVLLAGELSGQEIQVLERQELRNRLVREKLLLPGWDPSDPVLAIAVYPKGKMGLPLVVLLHWFQGSKEAMEPWDGSWHRRTSSFWRSIFTFTAKGRLGGSLPDRISRLLGRSTASLSIKFRSPIPPAIFTLSWKAFRAAEKLTLGVWGSGAFSWEEA